MTFNDYIDARLSILIPVLYCVGTAIKRSSIADWLIPYILGVCGVLLATVYLIASDAPSDIYGCLNVLFAGISQGILCASASVYADNLVRQAKKRNETEEDDESDA